MHFLPTAFPSLSHLLSSSWSFQIHICLLVISAGLHKLKISFSVSQTMSKQKFLSGKDVCCRINLLETYCYVLLYDHWMLQCINVCTGVTFMMQLCSNKVLVLLNWIEELGDWCRSTVSITSWFMFNRNSFMFPKWSKNNTLQTYIPECFFQDNCSFDMKVFLAK